MNTQSHEYRRQWRRLPIALAFGAGLGLIATAASAANAGLPMPRHEGNVTYLSGGIGDQEALALKKAAASYPLEVEFLKKEPNGHAAYLADDPITIRDHAGKTVLKTTSDGPFLLAKLPPGRYTISASDKSLRKERSIDLAAGKHHDVIFEW